MNELAILTEGLTKKYRISLQKEPFVALDDLNLRVERGEIFGLLGPNGAGKTTTLSLLLGFRFPTSGCAHILGEPIGSLRARARIGFVPELPALYEYLSADEVMSFDGRLFGLDRREIRRRSGELLELVGLTRFRKRNVASYSKGMRQRLGLAESLINDPELLFLDEPTGGLDPIGRQQIRNLLLDLRKKGKTIFLCSHILSDVELVCNRIGILYGGKLLESGRLEDLLAAEETLEIRALKVSPRQIADIKAMGIDAALSQDGLVSVTVAREKAAAVIRVLTRDESELVSVVPRRLTLEEVFTGIIERGAVK